MPPAARALAASVEVNGMKKSDDSIVQQETGFVALPENRLWLALHAVNIAQYNAWANTREPDAQRARRGRQSQVCKLTEADGAV